MKKNYFCKINSVVDRIRIHFGRQYPDPHWEYGYGSSEKKTAHKI